MPTHRDTTAIKDKLYPIVNDILSSSTGKTNFKKAASAFVSARYEDLYDTMPCSRIVFGQDDIDLFFSTMKIDKSIATEAISETYFKDIPKFNPVSATDEFSETLLMCVRFFYMKNMKKELTQAMIYLAFSGKFYPSLHFRSYPNNTPVRYVMDYVVNNCLSNKYDLVTQGSIIKVITSICDTWINTYGSKLKESTDEDCAYVLQQLHSRIGSFMKNIATAYYKNYGNKDAAITYDADNLDTTNGTGYRVADSDSLRITQLTEKTMNYIINDGVNYKICSMCADSNIRPAELQSIIESVLGSKDNLPFIKELINLLILNYYIYGGGSDVTDISFLSYSVSSKPNAKQKDILRQGEIIKKLLEDNSSNYIRRRSRLSTAYSYERAIRLYFAICIHTLACNNRL